MFYSFLLSPTLFTLAAVALVMARFVPLNGWIGVLAAGSMAGLVFDTFTPGIIGERTWSVALGLSICAAVVQTFCLTMAHRLFKRMRRTSNA